LTLPLKIKVSQPASVSIGKNRYFPGKHNDNRAITADYRAKKYLKFIYLNVMSPHLRLKKD